MTPADVLATLAGSGVVLHLDGGRLRFRAAPGGYSDAARALVSDHRQSIIDHLAGEQVKASAVLADVLALLARASRLATAEQGRVTVLEVYGTLARRWHTAGDPKLFELPDALAALLARWGDTNNLNRRPAA